jgi:hypothetical protein
MLVVPRSAPWMATFTDGAGRQHSDGFLTAASLRQTLGDYGRSLNQDSVQVGIARAVAWPLWSAREHDLQSPSRFATIHSRGAVNRFRDNLPNKRLNLSSDPAWFATVGTLGAVRLS